MSANCEEQPTSSTPQTIQLAGIVNDSITDGPGIRLTVFVQGCPHHCPGCHNQQTWDFAGGRPATTEEIWQQIQQNPLLSGVTFSGGEPMAQAAALLPLAQLIKQAGLELAIYTGYGPFILAQRNLELNFRGSANQRILKVTESLAAGQPVLEQAERWH